MNMKFAFIFVSSKFQFFSTLKMKMLANQKYVQKFNVGLGIKLEVLLHTGWSSSAKLFNSALLHKDLTKLHLAYPLISHKKLICTICYQNIINNKYIFLSRPDFKIKNVLDKYNKIKKLLVIKCYNTNKKL